MRTWLMAGLVLSLVVLALAPTGQSQGKAPGPWRFDPKTVVTVQGIVVDAPVLKPGGIPEMVHLTLETQQKRLTVVLGPNWYMAQQGWNINALDRLEVTGSSLQLDGKPTLLAQEVKKALRS